MSGEEFYRDQYPNVKELTRMDKEIIFLLDAYSRTLDEIKIKEFVLDKELNDVLIAVLELKKAAKRENIGVDDMETYLLEVLTSAGIEFWR